MLLFSTISISLFAFQAIAADGDVDTTFGTNGIINETSPFIGHFSVVTQSDGKIIAAGNALVLVSISPFVVSNHLTLVRYNANGSRDTSFATNGLLSIILPGKNLSIPLLLLQPDSKIIVFASQQQGNPILLRYNANGTPDNTFGDNGLVVTAFSSATTNAALGDGKILLADWVQAGRYAIGLDAVVAAGEPIAAVPNLQSPGPTATLEADRILRAVNANFVRGQVGTMQIALDAQGNENAVSFSLQFDPKVMSFVEATAGDGANGATVLVNSSQVSNGRVGIAIMLPPGQQFIVGTRTLVNIKFTPNGGIDDVSTSVSFSDQLLTREVVDAFANSITQISYVGSTVNISGKAVATVSAANYAGGELAADSIASVFGLQLSSMTQSAVTLPLPISLGGSQIVVKDSRGAERFAPLFYASPGQINFQIPAGTAEGIATLTVFSGAGASQTGLVIVGKLSPALFSADSTGVGLAAGSALLVRADGSRAENSLARYDSATGKFIGQPIDTGGSGDQVYLTIYGTGIKNRSDLAIVKVKIGGIDSPVEYAGAQGFFVGLDQLNIRLPAGLAGKGEVIVETNIENKNANQLRIVVK